MESTNNKTFIPLESNRVFIGNYDDVTKYTSCVISCISDQDCLITVFQSQNKTSEFSFTYNTVAGVQFTKSIDITNPYIYFAIRNQSNIDQTYLGFTAIYKTEYSPVIPIQRIEKTVWNTTSVSTAGVSLSLDCSTISSTNITVFGTTSVSGVVSIQFSSNGTAFYTSQYTASVSIGNFGFSCPCSSSFIRLKWTGSTSTITSMISVS